MLLLIFIFCHSISLAIHFAISKDGLALYKKISKKPKNLKAGKVGRSRRFTLLENGQISTKTARQKLSASEINIARRAEAIGRGRGHWKEAPDPKNCSLDPKNWARWHGEAFKYSLSLHPNDKCSTCGSQKVLKT